MSKEQIESMSTQSGQEEIAFKVLNYFISRPCFVPDKKFKYTLARYPGKEEITAPKS